MSRHIDADALVYSRVRIAHEDGTIGGYNAVVMSSEIKNAPTVDAIPISFIEKKIESIRQYLKEHEGEAFTSGLISKAIAYERLIEEWRREHD